jgi:hypothetical protein
MKNARRLPGVAARLAATLALVLASSTAAAADGPDLHLGFGEPAYALAAACDPARPLVTLNVVLQNDGTEPTVEGTVTATDDHGTLSGSQPVPAIDAGAHIALTVGLSHAGGGPASDVAGDHAIFLTAGDRTSDPRTITIPQAFCVASPAGPRAPGGSGTKPRPKSVLFSDSTTVGPSGAVQGMIAAQTLAAPTLVRSIFGPDDCVAVAHAKGFGVAAFAACGDLIKSGHLALTWNWAPGAGPSRVDGYHVYRVKGDAKLLVGGSTAQPLLLPFPVADVADAPGLNLVKCYVVSAYAGARESVPSAPFCTDAKSVAAIVRVAPVRVRSHREQDNSDHRFDRPSNEEAVIVGFRFINKPNIVENYHTDTFVRAALLFDVSSLRNRLVVDAKLMLKVARSEGAAPQHSCATQLGLGNGYWWQNGDQLDANFGNPIFGPSPRLNDTGPDITVDLRPLVARWLSGEPNFGIVLRNGYEAPAGADVLGTNVCETTYFDPVLAVTYY